MDIRNAQLQTSHNPDEEFKYDFKKWQDEVNIYLDAPVDRRICFVVDADGGAGKTTFCKFLSRFRENCQYFRVLKKEDLFHMAQLSTNTFLLDVPRAEAEFLNYASLEALKDGIWTSGKYQGKTRNGENCWVVVFLNSEPKLD